MNLGQDQTRPTINALSPVDGQTYSNGQRINFTVELNDDRGLKSYRIKIEFDQKRNESSIHGTPWYYSESFTTKGRKVAESRIINVPSNALAGPYRLVVYCTDEKDNQADSVDSEINLYNTNDLIPPQFSPNGLPNNSTHSVSLGVNNSFVIKDTISDNDYLTTIMWEGTNNVTGQYLEFTPGYIDLLGQGQTNLYYFERTLFFQAVGTYTFHLWARDATNNTGTKTLKFVVTP
jgi:hypothetical protein